MLTIQKLLYSALQAAVLALPRDNGQLELFGPSLERVSSFSETWGVLWKIPGFGKRRKHEQVIQFIKQPSN